MKKRRMRMMKRKEGARAQARGSEKEGKYKPTSSKKIGLT